MKQLIALILPFLPALAVAQDEWSVRDSINDSGRSSAAGFVINEECWIVTGANSTNGTKRYMHSYDLAQDDWDDEEPLGGSVYTELGRRSAVAFAINGFGYVALGQGSSFMWKDTWKYDDDSKTWTQVADYPGGRRTEAVAFVIDSTAYVGSGYGDDFTYKSDFYAYSAGTNSWTAISDCPGTPRKNAVGFTMGGRGYFGTGRGDTGKLNDFWDYYPPTDTWTSLADLPGGAREGAVGVGVFPHAYIMLGSNISSTYLNDVWEYNYFGDSWTQRADFPGTARAEGLAWAIAQKIFVGSGYDETGTHVDDFWEYWKLPASAEEMREIRFELYPNPSYGTVNIKVADEMVGSTIDVFDLHGKHIFTNIISETNYVLNGENMAPGTYTVQLKKDNLATTNKLIIQ